MATNNRVRSLEPHRTRQPLECFGARRSLRLSYQGLEQMFRWRVIVRRFGKGVRKKGVGSSGVTGITSSFTATKCFS